MTRWTCLMILVGLFAGELPAQEPAPPEPPPAPRAPAMAIVSPPIPATASGEAAFAAAGKSPLAEVLTKVGETFTDVTSSSAAGKLDFADARVLVVGSGALSQDDGRIAKVLWDAKKLIADFVESGGILVVFTAPADAGALGFLPGVTPAGIEALTHGRRVTPRPDHGLVAGRHKLSERDFGTKPGVLYPGGCYGVYLGLAPVVSMDARGRYPILVEGQAGKGRVILIHLSPDRAFLLGTDDEKVSATLLIENLLSYVRKILAGEAPAPKPAERSVRGVVFEDANANGVRDGGEKPIAGIEVSDGSALVTTAGDGRFYLPLDAYSDHVWVAADLAKYKGPFWRPLGADGAPIDIGLVPRQAEKGSFSRIVHIADVGGLINPTDKDDPELAWMVAEAARIVPRGELLVVAGDTTSRELRADALGRQRAFADVVNVFVAREGAVDPVAERDAFARTFGPTAFLFRLNGVEIAVTSPRLLEGRLPVKFAGPTSSSVAANRLEFTGGAFRSARLSGVTPSFRMRGLAGPPGFSIIDRASTGPARQGDAPLGEGPSSRRAVASPDFRAEWRMAGLRGLFHCIRPGLESAIPAEPLRPVLALGDTALGGGFPVKVEMAHVERRSDGLDLVELALGEYALVPRGRLTRSVEFKKPLPLTEGYYILRFSAASADGKPWTRNMTFSVPPAALPSMSVGSPWPATGGNDARTGEAKDAVSPPFYLAGVVNAGMLAPGESPVVLSDVVLLRGEAPGIFPPAPAGTTFAGLPLPVKRFDFPFACVGQGRYELRADHVALATGPVMRHDFSAVGARHAVPVLPQLRTSHVVVGGDVLCVVDSRGAAWGFARSRGAVVTDGKYDPKVAADSRRWKTDVLPGCLLAVATSTALFTGSDCVELGSGRVRWSWEKYALRERRAALSGKYLVMTGVTPRGAPATQKVVCLEADTGRFLWEQPLAEVHPLDDAQTPAPAIAKGLVFVGSADGVFRALRLSPEGGLGGAEVWRFTTGPSVLPLAASPERTGRISSQAALTEQAVFFGAADGKLYALDRRKGTLLWSYDLGIPVTGPCALSGNSLWVTDWDGNLYCFVSLAAKKGRR